MPAQVSWYLEGHIIHARYIGRLSLQDVQQVTDEGLALAGQGKSAYMHIIVDNREVEKFDFGLNDVRKLFASFPKMDNAGYVIVINSGQTMFSPVIRLMSAFVMQLLGLRFRIFDSLEGGVAFLGDVDESVAAALQAQKTPETPPA